MATATEAIERIAEATGMAVATVDRYARVLKQHKPNLWPRSGQGGGSKAAHVRPHHLVNLVLALAVADPITSAPQVVPRYKDLMPVTSRTRPMDYSVLTGQAPGVTVSRRIDPNAPELEKRAAWLDGDNLGEALECLIWMLSTPKAVSKDEMRSDLRKAELIIVLEGSDPIPHGQVLGSVFDENGHRVMLTDSYYPRGTLADLPNAPPGAIGRSARLSLSLFEVLADLWLDTIAHWEANPVSSAPPAAEAAGQKDENAGDLCHKVPAPSKNQPRANGAELGDHPRANGSGRLVNRSEGICEKIKIQGYADAGAGHSLTNPSGVAHARPRFDPAPAPCA